MRMVFHFAVVVCPALKTALDDQQTFNADLLHERQSGIITRKKNISRLESRL